MPHPASPYQRCMLCPRTCRVDRTAGQRGYCGETHAVQAAAALLHFGEEPPITGAGGSGTVFFTGCTLQCRFCQNWQVSCGGTGAALEREELADIFLSLQRAGAENVNAVTGTHFSPGILDAYHAARDRGLTIPLVWNSSGYETARSVALLAPSVRYFLPDLKSLDPALSERWLRAADYPRQASQAILAMVAAKPLVLSDGQPVQGVIMRHLVLPGLLDQTRQVLEWFRRRLAGKALLSLMFQYTPIPGRILPPPFDRMLGRDEHRQAIAMLEELGIEDGYYQEPETGSEWLPDFTRARPFPADRSQVVWHC